MTRSGLRKLVMASAALGMVAAGVLAVSPLAAGHAKLARAHRTCPASDQQPLTSRTPGAGRKLVPAGAYQVRLCRYGDMNAGSNRFRLVAQRLVRRLSTVRRLAREFNALKQLHGTFACPVDAARNIIAFFRYAVAGKPDDPVTVDVMGCPLATNGHVTRTAMDPPGPKLISRLEALTSKH